MVIFHSYVKLPEGKYVGMRIYIHFHIWIGLAIACLSGYPLSAQIPAWRHEQVPGPPWLLRTCLKHWAATGQAPDLGRIIDIWLVVDLPL